MRRLFTLIAILVATTATAAAQDCERCEVVNTQLICVVVQGGEFGALVCDDDRETNSCGEDGSDECYSCGVGPCEWGRHAAPAIYTYAAFRPQEKSPSFTQVRVDAATIERLAHRTPELAYAVALAVSRQIKIRDGGYYKLMWLPFKIDARHVDLWLNPTSADARAYFAVVREEGKLAAQNGAKPVEVWLEVVDNELVVSGIAGTARSGPQRIKVPLKEGQLIRSGGGAKI